jgi:hypothetical protein
MSSSDKVRATFASLAIVAFALLLFHPAIFGGKILAPLDITTTMFAPWNEDANGAKPHNHNPTDAVTQYLPYRIFAEKSLREDGYIGWNPYEMGGYSLAGNTMALPGNWTLQLHRFLPFAQAWNLGIIAEFLIAGFGMLVFLRSRNLPWLPCIIGAVAFMANSQFIIWIYHRWALSSFCWMPWILWSAAGLSSFRELQPRHYALPLFLAMAMLGASLQHVIFIFLACVCIFLAQVREFRKPLQEVPRVALWAVAFLLATAIASFTLVPQIQGYLTNISIGHTRGGIGYAEGAAQPFLNFIAIFAQVWPWLVGDPQTIDGWRLLKSGYMNQAFLGTIPMLLAICGMFNRNMPKAAKWLIAFGLLIPLTPLVGPLYHRIQLLFLLGAAWMTAEMLARYASQAIDSPPRWHKFLISAVAAIGLALLAGSLLPSSVRETVKAKVVEKSLVAAAASQFGSDTAWIENRARRWVDRFALHNPRTACTYGLLVLGTGGLILATRRRPAAARWGQVVILVTTCLELFTLFQTWTTYASPAELHPSHPLFAELKETAGGHRVLQGMGVFKINNMFAPANMLAARGIPTIDAYESIQYPTTIQSLKSLPLDLQLSIAGVGASIQPSNIPAVNGTEKWTQIIHKNGFIIRQNPTVFANVLAGTEKLSSQSEELSVLLATTFPIKPKLATMNRLILQLPEGTRWLRICQNWHEGWRWKTASGSWQPFSKGRDNTCWIRELSETGKKLEVRFFPYQSVVMGISITSTCLASIILLTSLIISVRNQSPDADLSESKN